MARWSLAHLAWILSAARSLDPALAIANQRDRWILWLSPALGIGIAGYFALPIEPAMWLAPMYGISLVPAFIWRRQAGAPASVVCAAAVLGFGVAQLRTAQVDVPVIDRKLGPDAFDCPSGDFSLDRGCRFRPWNPTSLS